jgi:hypothetical protein
LPTPGPGDDQRSVEEVVQRLDRVPRRFVAHTDALGRSSDRAQFIESFEQGDALGSYARSIAPAQREGCIEQLRRNHDASLGSCLTLVM